MILDCYRLIDTPKIYLGNKLTCIKIDKSLTGIISRKKWINSSGKNDPPPDFYNDKKKLMMDVMRIDDHAYINKKGKANMCYEK